MKIRMLLPAALFMAASAYVVVDASQEGAPPGPAPEHKLLEKYVGTWDCEVEASFIPGAPPEKNKGTSIERLACGGFWLVADFQSTMMGAPFSGHAQTGYDPAAKKYVTTWVDSMTPSLSTGEGTYDEKSKTFTSSLNSPGPDGQMVAHRIVEVWKDADTRDWTMYSPGPDGKEAAGIHIVYRRKK